MAYKDPERLKEYMRYYNKERRNKHKAKLQAERYRATHKKEIKEYHRLLYIKNKAMIDKRNKDYYINNKNTVDQKHKQYDLTHKEERKKYIVLYYKQKREYIRQTTYEYRKRTGNGAWRCSKESYDWKTAVYKRDNYTCQDCGKTHCKVNAHHIKSAKDYPELRYDVQNGICLCVECHVEIHKIKRLEELNLKTFLFILLNTTII